MSRQDIIRTLYFGGQAAIAAEVITIIGILMFAIFLPEFVAVQQNNPDSVATFREIVDLFNDNRTSYVMGVILQLLVPTVVMLVVVWAWHLYFLEEGIRLISWVATSLAAIGAALLLAAFAINTWGVSIAADAIRDNTIGYNEVYVGYVISFALQSMGIAALYIMYPVLLAVASWRKHLLPRWFVAAAAVFICLNDLNFLYGRQKPWLMNLVSIALVLFPFMMGVIMLRKAQTLANLAYLEAHGTPPPTPTTWREGWKSSVNDKTPHE